MSWRLRAFLAAALAGPVAAVAISTIAPQAAQAVPSRPVWSGLFTGPTQVADCNAAGQAGVNAGKWDFYHCLPGTGLFAGDTVGTGYIITG
jgi:hypothetical protein